MGRLKTISLILILSVWGGAVQGAAPDDAAAAPISATRQPPPAPPIKYLEAGARLFNSAVDNAQLELAAKYLQAASSYRDQLQPDEQATLDAYLKELAKAKSTVASAPAPASPVSATQPSAAASARPQPVALGAARPGAPAPGPTSPNQVPPSIDTKQRARWLLHEAREQLQLGNYDVAQRKAGEAEALDVKWGLFDDTPAKVTEDINKARPKAVASAGRPTTSLPHDRKTARVKLREARTAMNNRQFEQAEAIALDVKTWGLTYGLFEDNPDKIAAAARALRRRDKIRNTSPRDQSSTGVYDILVQESRQLMSRGMLDEAEAKARQAQRMNVVPPLTADRAESVLHQIAMVRAQKAPSPVAALPAAEPPSVKLEREANALLAKGDQDAAAAKFSEAERTNVGEAMAAVNAKAAVPSAPVADAAVQQIAAVDAGPAPDLAAPTDNPVEAQPAAAPAVAQQPAPAAPAAQPAAATAPAPAAASRPIAASSCSARPKNCTRTAITRQPNSLRARPRQGSLASMPRPTN